LVEVEIAGIRGWISDQILKMSEVEPGNEVHGTYVDSEEGEQLEIGKSHTP
jgi:hypothetical protein